MKRIDGAAALSLSLALCGAAFAQTENLITNPGFEQSGSGWILWTEPTDSVAVSAVTYPDSGAYDGTRYARVEVTEPAASAEENWHIQFQTPTGWVAVLGATYDLTFWAKSDSSSTIHIAVQGSDYSYLTGSSFGLTPEWTEYYFSHYSDAEGTNGVRFHIYVAETVDVYSFDNFTLTETLPVAVHAGTAEARQTLQVLQGAQNLTLTLDGAGSGNLNVELVDLRGVTVASKVGPANSQLHMPLPGKSGIYFVRANSGTKVWVRKVLVP